MRIRLPGLGLSLTISMHPAWRLELARVAAVPARGGSYSGHGLSGEGRILDPIRSERFMAAYTAGMSTPHTVHGGRDLRIHWRVHRCLFDTFEGIPVSQASREGKIAESKNARIYKACYEEAKRTFASFPNVHVVRGIVPDSLHTVAIDQVAYLSIDMNLAYPEIAALEFFWDRLVPGAIVVLDDYGFAGHRQQHDAINAFAAARNVPVYASPTGQGVIIRPPSFH